MLLAACGDASSIITAPEPLARSLTSTTDAGTGTTALTSGLAPSLCADILGSSTSSGARLITWSCHGQPNQQFVRTNEGELRVYGNMCVDALGGAGRDGDAVIIWQCHGGPNQRWTVTDDGRVVGINGKCLDIAGAGTGMGTALILWTCHGGANQRWTTTLAGGTPTPPAPPPPSAPTPPPPPPAPLPPPPISAGGSPAELPREQVDVTMPSLGGRSLYVSSGGSLQAAIDSSRSGDVINVQPGAVFDGTHTLRRKAGTGWIVIRTAVPEGAMPAPGTRMTPARAASANLARVRADFANNPAFKTEPGAARWRLIGLEIAPAPPMLFANALIELGNGTTAELTSRSELPQDIILDRLYVHGTATLDVKRCVAFHSGRAALVDSYLADCHDRSSGESQAIIGYNGSGPYRIENNYLEGAGMGIMFGGAAPGIVDMVPSDITIRRNHFFKPLSWKGVWPVKNMLELKIGRRVLIEQNVFENNWVDGQSGPGILFKSSAQVDHPTQGTEDVTFRWNHVRCSPAGLSIAARPGDPVGTPARRIAVTQNLWTEIGTCNGTRGTRLVQVLGSPDDVAITQNTFVANDGDGPALLFDGGQGARLTVTNNIFPRQLYGIFGSGWGEGTPGLSHYYPNSYSVTGNVFSAAPGDDLSWLTNRYPAGNSFVTGIAAVGFVNPTGDSNGDYRLSTSSAFQGRGVDVATLNTLLAGVR